MSLPRKENPRTVSIRNIDIAAALEEIADLLEIEGANAFRVRAYRNAVRAMQGLGMEVADMIANGEDLTELPDIGKDLAGKIKEIAATGRCRALDELRVKTPSTITALLNVPGLGPKRVHAIYHTLNIQTAEDLARAARDGRIRELPRFGPRIEQAILDALSARIAELGRFPLADAAREGEALKRHLETTPGVEHVEIAGSYRRRKETVGDLDFIVVAGDPAAAMDRFVAYGQVRDVLAKGSTRAAVRLRSGMQVDLRVVERDSAGAALLYFTGSQAHNIALRRLALKRKLKVNEYGVFKGNRRIAGDTEESVYATLGLRWIPPQAREDAGEIERARIGNEKPPAPHKRPTPPSRKRQPNRLRPGGNR